VEAFAPIAPSWPARAAKLGEHAGRWSPSRWWEQPFPEGFDPAYFNVAPPDQQVRPLQGDEAVLLENLSPVHQRLSMNLPAVRPRATATHGVTQEDVPLCCDTLWIDTDRGLGALVWRGWVRLRDPREEGAVVVSLEQGAGTLEAAATAAAALVEMVQTLPFQEARSAGRAAQAPRREEEAQAPEEEEDEDEAMVSTEARPELRPLGAGAVTMTAAFVPAGEALPFREGAAGMEPVPKTARAGEAPAREEARQPAEAAPPRRRGRGKTLELGPEVIAAAVAAGALPFQMLSPEMLSPEALARPDWTADSRLGAPDTQRPEPEIPVAGKSEPRQEEPRGLPLDRYPLERCAALAASIARRKQDKAGILERNDLSTDLWEDLKKHWDGEISKEIRRGRTDLFQRYDAAYVAQIEKERGPITIDEYARIVVGTERGAAHEILEELDLPRGAAMRVERVWGARLSRNGATGAEVRRVIGEARGRS
jgi:hypothetical protein